MKVICAFFLGGSSLLMAADTVDWSDSGIAGPPYSQILKTIESWKNRYPELTEVVDYGITPGKRTMRLMVVRKNVSLPDRPTLLMSGSTHGNEYLNLEDRLPELLLDDSRPENGTVRRFLDKGGVLIFIPILNPDGYATHRRENLRGIDLNRDWAVRPARYAGFEQIESRALAQQLEKLRVKYNLVFKITVDYHCCIGALLHPWAYRKGALPPADLARHHHIGVLANRYMTIDEGATGQVLGYYALGTTKDYYYDRYGALAFTFEGHFSLENQYLDKHLSWWKDMIDSVTSESSRPLFSLALDKVRAWFRIAE